MNVEREHELTSKGNMIIATAVAVFVMIMKPWGFGLWWFLIIPILWFASSILVAMPFGILKTTIAKRSIVLGGMVDWANYLILVPLTYFVLKWLNQWAYGWK
jgi:hypothetical protein